MNADSKLHILPFGPRAWERRKEIFAGIIAASRSGTLSFGLPSPAGWEGNRVNAIEGRGGEYAAFRDVLILVPNERKVKPLLSLFIDALQETTGSAGCIPPAVMALNRFVESRIRGVKIIHPTAGKLLLEDICRGLKGSRSTGFNLPGLEDEALARSLSGPISEAFEKAYLHYGNTWPENGGALLSALAYVKKEYGKRLDKLGFSDRSGVLAGWEPKSEDFSEYRVIILDGFYDALPHELRLMKALSDGRELHFIIEAQGLALPELCAEGMPYAGTDRLLNALFPGEAASPLAPDTGSAKEEDARVLSGAAFLGRPISETARLLKEKPVDRPEEIKIISALTPEDEVVFIARTIKERALKGQISLDRTLVLFPEPEAYAHALKEIFTDYGIPHSFRDERPLLASPSAQAFISLASIPAEGYPFRLMRRAFYLPGCAPGAAADFERHVRERSRRTGGIAARRSFWEALAGEGLSFSGELSKILGWVAPLDRSEERPAKWAELSLELLKNIGMTDPLEPLKETIEGLRDALKNLGIRITPGRFVSILKDAAAQAATGQPGGFWGVRALGRLEAFSEGFETVFIAGMNSTAFPPAPRQDLFFGTAPWSMDGRTRDSRLFLGLLLGAREAYLSYPKEKGGRAASPSPWITALKPFVIAGRAEEINDYSRPSAPEAAMGKLELRRALAIGCGQPGNEGESPPEIYYPPQERRKFSVTELENYIRCGYRYYYRHILRDMPPEEPAEGGSPDMAGRVVHDILAKFYAGRKSPVGPDETEAAAAEISKLAQREFAKLPENLANREAKRKFLEKFVPRVLAADSELPAGVVITDVEKNVEAEIIVSDTDTAVITGKIDRLELNENGSYTVVDYKTGRYPNGKDIPLGKEFQLPLYAYLLRRCLPERRPSSFVYYNLGRAGNARDVVRYDNTRYSGKKIGGKGRKLEDGAQMDEYIDAVTAKAKEAARGIIEGRFPRTDDKYECRYCELADSCPGADGNEPGEGER